MVYCLHATLILCTIMTAFLEHIFHSLIVLPDTKDTHIDELNLKTLAGKRGNIDQNTADQRQTVGMRKLSLCISLTLEGEKPIS